MDIQESRPTELQQVMGWFSDTGAPGSVEIFGLSGFGGIGKSYLLNHALEQVRPRSWGGLKISIDGSDRSILGNMMAIYEKQLRPSTVPGGKRNYNYFPESGKLARKHAEIEKKFEDELEKGKVSDNVKMAAKLIFRGGKLLNKAIPKIKEYVDIEALAELGIDKHVDEAIEVLTRIDALDLSWVPTVIKGPLGIGYADRIKSDLFGLAAEEWIADVSAILGKPLHYKLTQEPVKEYSSLLLVIDDFEILGSTVVDFLVTSLIRALQSAPFATKIVIVGRDDLFDANISFQHHLSCLVIDKLRLERFDPAVTEKMLLGAGYSTDELPELLEESQGYPFIVSLLCEAKGGTVSFYKRFFERTTRWMTETQKTWVLPLCYLDRIDEQTVERMLGPSIGKAVMEWFSNEASLRDPNAQCYVIAPYIRRTLKAYHSTLVDTETQGQWEERGRDALGTSVRSTRDNGSMTVPVEKALAKPRKPGASRSSRVSKVGQ
jgi:hypothetical protein